MTTGATLRALDGMTVPQLATKMVGKLPALQHDLVVAGAHAAVAIISEEGNRFYIRVGKARKPIHLSAVLGPHSGKAAIVTAVPAGFWSIVEKGIHPKSGRIIPKGKGRSALLRTPYGPRPYVLKKAHGPQGHPWVKAMARVDRLPQGTFDPSVTTAFKGIWR